MIMEVGKMPAEVMGSGSCCMRIWRAGKSTASRVVTMPMFVFEGSAGTMDFGLGVVLVAAAASVMASWAVLKRPARPAICLTSEIVRGKNL